MKSLYASEQEELWRLLADEESKTLDRWEKQIEADSHSGKLDHLLAELAEEIAAGRVKPRMLLTLEVLLLFPSIVPPLG